MDEKKLVAATRRLPSACEERLVAQYKFRKGDDTRVYSVDALAAQAANAAALIVTPAENLDGAAIKLLPETIKIIATFSVGYERIDLSAAKARGMRVSNTPGVLSAATADLTLLLILAATRRAYEGAHLLRSGAWTGIRPTQLLGSQLTGKCLGILGMGRIGCAVAARARVFGMTVLYHNRNPAPPELAAGASYVSCLKEFLPQCDVLSLHCPLTKETKNILNADCIALLPDGAVVINAARGPLVDDDALIAALTSDKLSAVGLDVYADEPAIDQRYLTLKNAFLLPHLGSATVETRTVMGMLAIDNIDAVLAGGSPPYAVN
jgi:lactate dehydrogenase-like 2-hydroxyacid dehydrogenase